MQTRPDDHRPQSCRGGGWEGCELLTVLDLTECARGAFTGTNMSVPAGRIYGGQLLAQSVIAAARTTGGLPLHSLHGYFLQPGTVRDEVRYTVTQLRNGRSFRSRRVDATQRGGLVTSVLASFHTPEQGMRHQEPMPEVPGPDGLPGRTLFAAADGPPSPVEARFCPAAPGTFESAVWLRVTADLPEDPLLHQALLVYLSDFSIVRGAFLRHDVDRGTLRTASLDHSMWFHNPPHAGDWLLYRTRSPAAADARVSGTGTFYDRSGTVLATAAQEMLVRPRSEVDS